MRIRIDIDKAGVVAALDALDARFHDWRPVWGEIHRDFMVMESRRFNEQPWEPWGPAYVKWEDPYTGHGFESRRILEATGTLRHSLDSENEWSVNRQEQLRAEFGTKYQAESNAGRMMPVAAILDRGFRTRGKMWVVNAAGGHDLLSPNRLVPGRRLIDAKQYDRRRWQRDVAAWVRREVAAVGL